MQKVKMAVYGGGDLDNVFVILGGIPDGVSQDIPKPGVTLPVIHNFTVEVEDGITWAELYQDNLSGPLTWLQCFDPAEGRPEWKVRRKILPLDTESWDGYARMPWKMHFVLWSEIEAMKLLEKEQYEQLMR